MNNNQSDKYVSRFYKISIDFGIVYYIHTTQTFKMRKGILPYLCGFGYFIVTLFTGIFFGFFGILRKFQGIRNTLDACYINLTGGEDITKLDNESYYDSYTVYIYNNLERKTLNALNLSVINIILEIQELYAETNTILYDDQNSRFILRNLSKVSIQYVTKNHIQSVFNAIEIHTKYNSQ